MRACSHSAVVSGPGFSHTAFETPSRPRSWRRAATRRWAIVWSVQAEPGRGRHRELGDLCRMTVGERCLDVGQITEGGRHHGQVGLVDLDRRGRLDLEDRRPRVSRERLGQQRRRHRQRTRRRRPDRAACPHATERGCRRLRVAERGQEHRVGGDPCDPRRLGDRVAAKPTGAAAVPPLVDVVQGGADGVGQSDATGDGPRRFAGGHVVPIREARAPRAEQRHALEPGPGGKSRVASGIRTVKISQVFVVRAAARWTAASSPNQTLVSCEYAMHPTCSSRLT